jgi:dTDP-4-amino-4,6-dideoxygalactose transaminase
MTAGTRAVISGAVSSPSLPESRLLAGESVPFVRPDLPDFEAITADLAAAVAGGMLTKGRELARLEAEAAAHLGVRHVVGVSSGTVGLMLVLAAVADRQDGFRSRTPRRREVIVPSFVFLAAPTSIVWAGLEPVFVDCDPDTFTVAPAAVRAAVSDRTAAIMACHTFGCPCAETELEAIAAAAGVPLLVDAAHGLGTRVGGRPVGAAGLAQVFSLSPTKLVVAGEGGLVATSCDDLADAIRTGREYGNDGHYGCTLPGVNGRLPEFSAILARASLARLPEVASRRRAAAAAYAEGLAGLPGLGRQHIPAGATSSFKDFVITAPPETRDRLRARLAARGIDTRAYYDPPCHAMEAFAGAHAGRVVAGQAPPLPVTERLAATALALPMGGHVTPTVASRVAAIVAEEIVAEEVAGSSPLSVAT